MPTPLGFIESHIPEDGSDAAELDMLRSTIIHYEREASKAATQRVFQHLRATYGEPGADA